MRWFMLVAAMAFATAHAQDLTNLQLARATPPQVAAVGDAHSPS
ncbi:MAG: hypothetical protein ACLQDM_26955 [Bradyrhizobium sp.]